MAKRKSFDEHLKEQGFTRAEDPEKDQQPVPPPPLFPIEQGLLSAFSGRRELEAEIEQLGDTGENWMDDEHEPAAAKSGEGGRAAGQQPTAAGNTEGAAAAGAAAATERSEQRSRRGDRPTAASSRPRSRARADTEEILIPQSLAEQLQQLKPWQTRVVLACMDTGGVPEVAARLCGVSNRTMEKFRAQSPEFDHALRDARQYALGLVEAALHKAATVGDLAPVYQGQVLVGYKRQRSDKAAETLMMMAGRLDRSGKASDQNHPTKVEIVVKSEIGGTVAATMQRLFQARRQQPLLDADTGRPVQQ